MAILFLERTALPIIDDYHAVLAFVSELHSRRGLARVLAVISFQHNDYKLIFEHAIIALQYGLSGHVNLGVLAALGNLFLLPIGLFYFPQFLPELSLERRLLLFLPISLLLYQLTYAELLDWTMSVLQNVAVVPFSLACLYFLTRNRSRSSFAWACVFGLLACLTSVNGFLVALVGGVILITRRWLPALLMWGLTFAVGAVGYLYHYTTLPHARPSLLSALLFIPTFVGSAFETMHRRPIPFAAFFIGVFLLAVAIHAVRNSYYKRRPFVMAVVTWVVLTAVMVAFGRAAMGVNQSLSSRYKIYCALMLAFAYQYGAESCLERQLLSEPARRRLFAIILVVCTCFALAADAEGFIFLKKRRMLEYQGVAWYLQSPMRHSPDFPSPDPPSSAFDRTSEGVFARTQLTSSLADGDYHLPSKEVAKACAIFSCHSAAPGENNRH
ncbi:MAG TPA: hypothetical protein VGU25_01070 [Acidobacteriaceae bacterium]|nr:hypothetical protein [Acidobacteriaceae bacterium]